MAKQTALIVDDERDIRELLAITLNRMGITTTTAGTVTEAHEQLTSQQFDLCLTDMNLPDGNGIDLVKHISEVHPQLPVGVITAYGSMEAAVEALKAGAFDFVSKPVDLEMLRKLVTTALKINAGEASAPATKKHSPVAKASKPAQPLLGKSRTMDRVRALIEKLGRSQAPVYIGGESGTGKELAARQIHALSPRAGEAFVAVNCGAIPAELMESEFFGHKKGSFTGAVSDKEGLFETADNGTLFLDEVGDLPLDMQVKMLRAIQEKRIRAVGGNTEHQIDVRIISATHKNLAEMVKQGTFREDLFYRLNVIELRMPPLRERPEDVEELAHHILERQSAGLEAVSIDKDAIEALEGYRFPGNVRELENILERAGTLCENNTITADDLLLPLTGPDDQEMGELTSATLDEHLESIERKIIHQALEEARWNRTEAAKKLGISFRSLRYRLEKLGLSI